MSLIYLDKDQTILVNPDHIVMVKILTNRTSEETGSPLPNKTIVILSAVETETVYAWGEKISGAAGASVTLDFHGAGADYARKVLGMCVDRSKNPDA